MYVCKDIKKMLITGNNKLEKKNLEIRKSCNALKI